MLRPEELSRWAGLSCCPADGDLPKNSYALVTYIPEPLRSFLDRLRLELVPGCSPNAHVTILPPRALAENFGADLSWKHIQSRVCDCPAFDVEATGIQIFDQSPVVYLAIGRGSEELVRMHDLLNSGPLWAEEQFTYEPHITLAQNLERERLGEIRENAGRRWAEFPCRRFTIEVLTFVQNTMLNNWLDLARCSLAAMAATR